MKDDEWNYGINEDYYLMMNNYDRRNLERYRMIWMKISDK